MTCLKRTSQAEKDLIDIWLFIAKENHQAADKLIRELDKRSNSLIQNPELGVLREDIAPLLRLLVHKNYLIMYRILNNDIEIVRYLHGARNLKTILNNNLLQ